MLLPSVSLAILASAGLAECRSALGARHLHALRPHKRQNDLTATVLAADAIQTGSFTDGSAAAGSAAGQSKSDISQNNFMNICAGKTLTNGLQVTTGSCNGITMGEIPSKANMVSSMIVFPVSGSSSIESNTTFQIQVQMSNFVPGSFTNAQRTYYSAPQKLSGGKIVGHTHVTVQDMGSDLNPKQPLDATKFVFFKGINDPGNGQGLLSASVTGGLPAGNYRVCTMASSSNHQPVLMPVAQRGSQDDCSKFVVIEKGGVTGGNGNTGGDANAGDGSTGGDGSDSGSTSPLALSATNSSSIAESTTSATAVASIIAPPFSNSTFATTKTRKNGGGKGDGKGGSTKVQTTSTTQAAEATTTAASSAASPEVTAITTKKGNGKGNLGGVKGVAKPTKKVVKIVHKVTIIRTFFKFISSFGGLPPSVNKKGNSFAVLEELFDDLASACDAACGHQHKTCISFSGPGFEVTECDTQQTKCKSAAVTESATVPEAITATVTVPPTATITGSVISEVTVSSTVEVTPTVVETEVPAATSDVAVAPVDNAACTLATQTVTVDPPSETAAAVSTNLPVIAKPPFSNSTASAIISSAPTASSSAAASTESSAAVGGIEAPAVTNSGDATRPFLVNGNTFVNEAAAIQRSCDIQFNKCADAVNGGKLTGVSVGDCSTQKDSCGK